MHGMKLRRWFAAAPIVGCSIATLMSVAIGLAPSRAEACGCLSPPDPVALDTSDFAVNQQAEQIIFEVGESTVSAHVQIRYQGDPEQFAWIVPVPNAPELELSHQTAFALIEEATTPSVWASTQSICPSNEYRCERHPNPQCEFPDDGAHSSDGEWPGDGDTDDGAGTGGQEPPPGVDVIDMQQVGSYDTVTFSADDAELAVQWLHENGFIVNETMTPYMQPYIDGGMVFVAAKLIAGAGVDAIAPLKITYEGTQPMIPLQLTAVAAEPHMTVSAYIHANETYVPVDHPVIDVDPGRIAAGPEGRNNYPMVLARSIDEAGGDGFVIEYEGEPIPPQFPDASGCCSQNFDVCDVGSNSSCECPGSDFDRSDCEAVDGLLEGIELAQHLADNYTILTRLTTRLSPEDMTFDPMFEGTGRRFDLQGRLTLTGQTYSLNGCVDDILDVESFDELTAQQQCTAVYCGEGACVPTSSGSASCVCNDGFAAKVFTDLDGQKSVTCVPEQGTVDLGLTTVLPDVCADLDCGDGVCLEVGGFPTCQCDPGSGAVPQETLAIAPCEPVLEGPGDPGADNYTPPLLELDVCAPAPPQCGEFSWLVPVESDNLEIRGVQCESSIPAPEDLVPPDPPTCEQIYGDTATAVGEDDEDLAGGCQTTGSGRGLGSVLLSMLLLGSLRLRRRNR